MNRRCRLRILFSFMIIPALVALSGCGHVISKEIREQAIKELTLHRVLEDPQSYKGKIILWAGEIVKSTNIKKGTEIEVLEKPTDFRGKPKDVDTSQGRFLVLSPDYLDVAIYAEGRKITVAGELQGSDTRTLGETEYTYPVVAAMEIYLWPKPEEIIYYYPYPYPPPYPPYYYRSYYLPDPYWHGPFWYDPFWP